MLNTLEPYNRASEKSSVERATYKKKRGLDVETFLSNIDAANTENSNFDSGEKKRRSLNLRPSPTKKTKKQKNHKNPPPLTFFLVIFSYFPPNSYYFDGFFSSAKYVPPTLPFQFYSAEKLSFSVSALGRD